MEQLFITTEIFVLYDNQVVIMPVPFKYEDGVNLIKRGLGFTDTPISQKCDMVNISQSPEKYDLVEIQYYFVLLAKIGKQVGRVGQG